MEIHFNVNTTLFHTVSTHDAFQLKFCMDSFQPLMHAICFTHISFKKETQWNTVLEKLKATHSLEIPHIL